MGASVGSSWICVILVYDGWIEMNEFLWWCVNYNEWIGCESD